MSINAQQISDSEPDRYDRSKYRIRELWNANCPSYFKSDIDPSVYVVEELRLLEKTDKKMVTIWLPFLHMQPRGSDFDYQVYYNTHQEAEENLVEILNSQSDGRLE